MVGGAFAARAAIAKTGIHADRDLATTPRLNPNR